MAVVLTGVAAYVYVNLRSDLRASIDSGLQSRAQVIRANVERSDPTLGGAGQRRLIDPDDAFAQVLSASGEVIESTPAVARAPLVPPSALPAVTGLRFLDRRPPGLDLSRLLVVPVRDGGRREFVVVGATLSDSQEALDTALVRFAVAFPVALLLSSLIGWVLAGAALRPVERMRREAEGISGSDPTGRLPVPETDDTLARLAVTLNRTFDRLQEALERERRFVDDASHELRTPLAILKAEVDSALAGERSEADLRQALAGASAEVNHLVRIAEDLLVLARAEHGRIPVRREPVSLRRIVEESCYSFLATASSAGVAIEAEAADIVADVDGTRFRQALDNLLANAIHHSPPGGVVHIDARAGEDDVTIVVDDSGPGFDPAGLEAVFQPFHRGRDAVHDGCGLGLAIVRAIAEAHDGTVEAANPADGGAQVTLRLAGIGRSGEAPPRDVRSGATNEPARPALTESS
jgi:two-component system OmpR family sensor kinase